MTDFDFLSHIGWRDLVLVAAAVIGVYLALSVMRLFQVAGKRGDGGKQEPLASPDETGFAPKQVRISPRTLQPEPPLEPQLQPQPEPEFARELARSNVEAELERLRREGALLREELARLTEEVSRLKATRNVSPLYNEAMTLAQQGMPANGIAGHCGISIGEAELVAALARGGSEFERHEQGGDHDERNIQSGKRLYG